MCSEHETKARRSCTQTARWFLKMATMTWMVRNITNKYTIQEIRGDRWSKNKCRKFIWVQIINKVVDDWHQWKVTRMNSKSSSSTSTIIEFSRIFYMNLDKSWVIDYCSSLREKRKKKTSIICVAKFHSLPWNTTKKAHKIRTTLKRRWIFKRASGNRSLHDAGKTRVSSKSSSGGSSNPMSIHPRTKSNYRRRMNPSRRTKLGLQLMDDRRAENIPSRLSSSSMHTSTPKWTSQWRSQSNELGCKTSSIENGRVYKIPKLTGKRIHVWGLVALPLTAEAPNV